MKRFVSRVYRVKLSFAFILILGNKYNALCMVCNTIVKNKSYYGMLSHRNVCIFYSTSAKPSTPSNQLTVNMFYVF